MFSLFSKHIEHLSHQVFWFLPFPTFANFSWKFQFGKKKMGLCDTGQTQPILTTYVLNLVASSLSVIGSLGIIISFIVSPKQRNLIHLLVFFLAIADLIGSLGISSSQM
jgi:hypothetical protein